MSSVEGDARRSSRRSAGSLARTRCMETAASQSTHTTSSPLALRPRSPANRPAGAVRSGGSTNAIGRLPMPAIESSPFTAPISTGVARRSVPSALNTNTFVFFYRPGRRIVAGCRQSLQPSRPADAHPQKELRLRNPRSAVRVCTRSKPWWMTRENPGRGMSAKREAAATRQWRRPAKTPA